MEKAEVHKESTTEQLLELRNKKRQDMSDQQVAELARHLNIKERLERKLKTDVIKIELEDDLGKFILKFRKLAPSEHEDMVKIQIGLKNADTNKTIELMSKLYEIIEKISLDDLDKEFWKLGKCYSSDILVLIVLKVMSASSFPDEEYMKGIFSFRPV